MDYRKLFSHLLHDLANHMNALSLALGINNLEMASEASDITIRKIRLYRSLISEDAFDKDKKSRNSQLSGVSNFILEDDYSKKGIEIIFNNKDQIGVVEGWILYSLLHYLQEDKDKVLIEDNKIVVSAEDVNPSIFKDITNTLGKDKVILTIEDINKSKNIIKATFEILYE